MHCMAQKRPTGRTKKSDFFFCCTSSCWNEIFCFYQNFPYLEWFGNFMRRQEKTPVIGTKNRPTGRENSFFRVFSSVPKRFRDFIGVKKTLHRQQQQLRQQQQTTITTTDQLILHGIIMQIHQILFKCHSNSQMILILLKLVIITKNKYLLQPKKDGITRNLHYQKLRQMKEN